MMNIKFKSIVATVLLRMLSFFTLIKTTPNGGENFLRDFKNLINFETDRYKNYYRFSLLRLSSLSMHSHLDSMPLLRLAFGEIPAKGIARYATIGAGFLGWFLLRLFSMALPGLSNF